MSARLAVTIVGAGGLARAMASALARSKKASVTIAARRPAAAAALARQIRGVRALSIEEAVETARIVLLAVPDRHLAALARQLSPLRSWRGVVVLHAAGAYGPEPLAALAARRAATGVLHPLAVLAAGAPDALNGAYARIEGAPSARSAARKIAVLCGLTPLPGAGLATAPGRRRYHAAASLAANDVVALLAAAQDLLVKSGVAERAARAAVSHLAAGAVAAVERLGPGAALTGPVVRNDAATVSLQLEALAAADPAAASAHRALSLRLVALAVASGRLTKADARALKRRLTV